MAIESSVSMPPQGKAEAEGNGYAALAGDECEQQVQQQQQQGHQPKRGTVLSTAVLYAAGSMGAGMLTLPFAVQEAGVRGAAVLLFLGSLLAWATTTILSIGSVALGATTYGEVVEGAVRRPLRIRGVSVLDALFFVYLMGCCAAFLIFVGDFVEPLARNVPGAEWCTGPAAIYLVALGIVGPLACMNEMNAVSQVAELSIVAILTTCTAVVVKSAPALKENVAAVTEAWEEPLRASPSTLRALGCMLYAFDVGAIVPPISSELQNPTPRRLATATACSTFLTALVYSVLAFTVFLAFAGHPWEDGSFGTRSDFTKNFESSDPMMSVCRALLVFSFTCAATQTCLAFLKSFYVCIGQAFGREHWKPSVPQRILAVYGSLLPAAWMAGACKEAGSIVAALGNLGACPETLAGPVLLIAFGHVGASMTRLQRFLVVSCMVALMVFLWTYSLVGF